MKKKVILIDANAFKKRILSCQYIYLQANKEDIIDAIDCEVTYFKEEHPDFQRPQGEWIFVSRNCWKCPCCQELTNEGKNFCPNCGVDMRGDNNG
jgi:hypothetical protein